MVEMAAPEIPVDKLGPWTFEDLFELPESLWRFEIVDGALLMTPPAGMWHEGICARLREHIRANLSSDFRVLGPVGVDIHPTYLIPDLLVVPADIVKPERNRAHPSELLLVVEVVSPGSVSADRILKPAKYAAAGVPAYWRVETKPQTSLTAYTLNDNATIYTEVGTWATGETAHLTQPFEIQLSIADLER